MSGSTGGPRRRRTRDELQPWIPEASAFAAAQRILELRAGHDEHFDYLPRSITLGDDLEEVARHPESHHPGVTDEILRAELPYRALLVAYLHQRAVLRYESRLLGVLNTGNRVHALPSVYGPPVGLPTRQACWNRRKALRSKRHAQDDPAPPNARRVSVWVTSNRQALVDVAETLVDHRDYLIGHLDDPTERGYLAEALDQTGIGMSARPTAGFAASVAYAVFLLRSVVVTDPVVRDGLARGGRLAAGFNEVSSGS